jgi:hypothetical protein
MLIFDPISYKNVEAGIAGIHIRLRKGVPQSEGSGQWSREGGLQQIGKKAVYACQEIIQENNTGRTTNPRNNPWPIQRFHFKSDYGLIVHGYNFHKNSIHKKGHHKKEGAVNSYVNTWIIFNIKRMCLFRFVNF